AAQQSRGGMAGVADDSHPVNDQAAVRVELEELLVAQRLLRRSRQRRLWMLEWCQMGVSFRHAARRLGFKTRGCRFRDAVPFHAGLPPNAVATLWRHVSNVPAPWT